MYVFKSYERKIETSYENLFDAVYTKELQTRGVLSSNLIFTARHNPTAAVIAALQNRGWTKAPASPVVVKRFCR